jgi:small subunit ribosomal protein S16
MGRRNRPFYRIVVTDMRAPRDGRYLECLGTYDALAHPSGLTIEESRANFWLDRGAVPSDTVRSLLKRQGILVKRNLKKRGLDETAASEAFRKWEAAQAGKAARKSGRAHLSKKAREKAAKSAEAEAAPTPAAEAPPA